MHTLLLSVPVKEQGLEQFSGEIVSNRDGLLPYNNLYGEPGITNTLDIEESIMRVCTVFVQGPGRHVVPRPDCDVPDDGDPHVRVSLQTEGQDRDADEEHGDDTDQLGSKGRVGLVKHEPDLRFCSLPPGDAVIVIIILVAEPLGNLLITRLLRVQVQGVQDGERLLSVPVLGVGHPAARLHLFSNT